MASAGALQPGQPFVCAGGLLTNRLQVRRKVGEALIDLIQALIDGIQPGRDLRLELGTESLQTGLELASHARDSGAELASHVRDPGAELASHARDPGAELASHARDSGAE